MVHPVKSASAGSFGTQWFLKMNPDKQDTLIKMSVLTMAAILCKYMYFVLFLQFYVPFMVISLICGLVMSVGMWDKSRVAPRKTTKCRTWCVLHVL